MVWVFMVLGGLGIVVSMVIIIIQLLCCFTELDWNDFKGPIIVLLISILVFLSGFWCNVWVDNAKYTENTVYGRWEIVNLSNTENESEVFIYHVTAVNGVDFYSFDYKSPNLDSYHTVSISSASTTIHIEPESTEIYEMGDTKPFLIQHIETTKTTVNPVLYAILKFCDAEKAVSKNYTYDLYVPKGSIIREFVI